MPMVVNQQQKIMLIVCTISNPTKCRPMESICSGKTITIVVVVVAFMILMFCFKENFESKVNSLGSETEPTHEIAMSNYGDSHWDILKSGVSTTKSGVLTGKK